MKLDNRALGTAIILLALVLLLFSLFPAYNEWDALAYAYSVYSPDWIEGDWYLSRNIEYRYLFSWASGWLVHHFGLFTAIYLGRLLSYTLFSVAFVKLIRELGIRFEWSLAALVCFLVYFEQNTGAHEWMIGGFETKVYAYACFLFSIVFLLKEEWLKALFFLGLSLSFHLLVGIYAGFVVLPWLLAKLRVFKAQIPWMALFYGLGGFVGLYGIWIYLGGGTEELKTVDGINGWDIYTWLRVPHHTMPNWTNKDFIWFAVFALVHIVALVKGGSRTRLFASVGLASYALLGVGWTIQYWGHGSDLRYYFYRLPDTWLPLSFLLLLASGLSHIKPYRSNWTSYGAWGIVVSAVAIAAIYSPLRIGNPSLSIDIDSAMAEYIRTSTDKSAVIMLPVDIQSHYWQLERPVWVTFKNSPQKANDLLEWFRRMQVQNRGLKPTTSGYALKDEVNRNFQKSSREDFERYSKEGVDYVLMREEVDGMPREAYRTENFILYKISSL